MQAVYGYERSEDALPATFRKSLQTSIQSVKDLYIYLLFSVREVANEVDTVARIKASKYLPTEEDKRFSTKLLSNSIIQALNNDDEFLKELKKTALAGQFEEAVKQHLYKKMIQTPEYKEYIGSDVEFDYEADRRMVAHILNDILLADDLFLEHVEEVFPSWEDDAEFVVSAVRDVFKKSKGDLKLHLEKNALRGKFFELCDFADKLFEKTLQSKEHLEQYIEPYLRNWEMDRVAVLDLIMLRMAITEFTDFPSIPVKVTINEYIDMARDYSTPKSKDFINGILDRMMKDMKDNGEIRKTGRGLLDK